jgi:hypothetical protein
VARQPVSQSVICPAFSEKSPTYLQQQIEAEIGLTVEFSFYKSAAARGSKVLKTGNLNVLSFN